MLCNFLTWQSHIHSQLGPDTSQVVPPKVVDLNEHGAVAERESVEEREEMHVQLAEGHRRRRRRRRRAHAC